MPSCRSNAIITRTSRLGLASFRPNIRTRRGAFTRPRLDQYPPFDLHRTLRRNGFLFSFWRIFNALESQSPCAITYRFRVHLDDSKRPRNWYESRLNKRHKRTAAIASILLLSVGLIEYSERGQIARKRYYFNILCFWVMCCSCGYQNGFATANFRDLKLIIIVVHKSLITFFEFIVRVFIWYRVDYSFIFNIICTGACRCMKYMTKSWYCFDGIQRKQTETTWC